MQSFPAVEVGPQNQVMVPGQHPPAQDQVGQVVPQAAVQDQSMTPNAQRPTANPEMLARGFGNGPTEYASQPVSAFSGVISGHSSASGFGNVPTGQFVSGQPVTGVQPVSQPTVTPYQHSQSMMVPVTYLPQPQPSTVMPGSP